MPIGLAIKQGYNHVAMFIQELLKISPHKQFSHSRNQSSDWLQETDQIITALV